MPTTGAAGGEVSEPRNAAAPCVVTPPDVLAVQAPSPETVAVTPATPATGAGGALTIGCGAGAGAGVGLTIGCGEGAGAGAAEPRLGRLSLEPRTVGRSCPPTMCRRPS